jgi:hypothetical protein
MALRRLQALEEFTDLGSGFQLAMRDLEIRGAGNLLGGEQSGFILEMGFELYQKILEEAVLELRHEEFEELFPDDRQRRRSYANQDVAVELDTDALIPHAFIPADTDRYDIYRRLCNATEQRQVDVVYDELRDRFGALPVEVEELLFAVRLRIVAIPTGFVRIAVRGERMIIELPPEENTAWYDDIFQSVMALLAGMSNCRLVQHGKRLVIEVILADRQEALFALERFAGLMRAPSVLPLRPAGRHAALQYRWMVRCVRRSRSSVPMFTMPSWRTLFDRSAHGLTLTYRNFPWWPCRAGRGRSQVCALVCQWLRGSVLHRQQSSSVCPRRQPSCTHQRR